MLEGEDGEKKETKRGSSSVPFWSRHAFPNEFNTLTGWCLAYTSDLPSARYVYDVDYYRNPKLCSINM